MTTAKNAVFVVIIRKLLFSGGVGFWWRGDKNLVVGKGSMAGGGSMVGGGGANLLLPSRESPDH